MKSVTKTKKPNDKSSLGERLAYARTSLKMSQEELAGKVYTKRESISYYENNSRTPDVFMLTAISKELKVSTDFLLGVSECSLEDVEMQALYKLTCLNEESIKYLVKKKNEKDTWLTLVLNFLIKQENSDCNNPILSRLITYFKAYNLSEQALKVTNGDLKEIKDFSFKEHSLSQVTSGEVILTKEIIDTVFLENINRDIRNAKNFFLAEYKEEVEK